MRKDIIIIKDLDGKVIHDKKLKFISRINNDGSGMIQHGEHPIIIGETIFRIHCLSLTYKKFIATCGMSTYIVELEPADGLYGKYIQLDDRFESVHIWSQELENHVNGRWTPIEITKEKYEKEMEQAWNFR